MSMWLNLAKISPELLTQVRANPELLEAFFFDENPTLPDSLEPNSDLLGFDYLTIVAIAEAKSVVENGDEAWEDHYPFFVRAVGADVEEDDDDDDDDDEEEDEDEDEDEVEDDDEVSDDLDRDNHRVLAGYDFGYGPAFVMEPAEVARVAEGLAEEGWDFSNLGPEQLDNLITQAAGVAPGEATLDDDDDEDDDDEDDDDQDDDEDDDEDPPEYDDFTDFVRFFAAAAREGKAVVGGVS